MPTASTTQHQPAPLWGPILTLGFGITVVMWIAACIGHLPWLNLSPRVAGPAVLIIWALAAIIAGKAAPRQRGVVITAAAGLLSAILGLCILGSQLTKTDDEDKTAAVTTAVATTSTTATPSTDTAASVATPSPTPPAAAPAAHPDVTNNQEIVPNAGIIVGGFLALGTVLGALGGVIGSKLRKPGLTPERTAHDWLATLSTVVCFSVVPLLISGANVTSTHAGMSIIGWPDSEGANMFLYPIKRMTQHSTKYFEHSHRLFGALTGLATLALTVYTLAVHKSRNVRVFAIVLALLIVAQGLMGGVRVLMGTVSPKGGALWALAHGIVAQLFFAATVAYAARVRPVFEQARSLAPDTLRRAGTLATLLLPAALLQLAFGAMYRHLVQPHALWSHAGFSIVVVILALGAGYALKDRALNAPADTRPTAVRRTLKRAGGGITHVVGLQFLLGWAAFWAVSQVADRTIPVGSEIYNAPAVSPLVALIRTAHHANGALLLAMATLVFVWARWIRQGPKQAS